jgi:cytochrome bd-type quinol oxidase subunit 2
MRDDYLWDRSGESDPEIAGLERTLAVLRHRGVPPRLAARSLDHRWKRGSGWPYSAAAGVIAALLILVVGALLIGLRPSSKDVRPSVGFRWISEERWLSVNGW